jgi:hypothetical protein
MLENIVRWQDDFDNQESYLLEDQKTAILLENSAIPRSYFKLMNKVININSFIKNYQVARFDESMIPDII